MRSGFTSALIALLSSCIVSSEALAQTNPRSSPPPAGAQETQPQAQQENAPSTVSKPVPGVAAPVDPKSYKIGAGDVLMVRVWGENELSGPVQVRPDGMITLPLVGDLKAGEMTPDQLTSEVTEALTKFINKPQVMVSVNAVLSKKYYISGEVGRTGSFPLVTPTTVVEALSNAGGFREFANKKKIVIMRGSERLKFNYNDYLKGKDLDKNILLQDGDHVYVP